MYMNDVVGCIHIGIKYNNRHELSSYFASHCQNETPCLTRDFHT